MPTYFEEIEALKKHLIEFWASTKELKQEIENIDEFGYYSLNYNCKRVTDEINNMLNALYSLKDSYTIVLKDQ